MDELSSNAPIENQEAPDTTDQDNGTDEQPKETKADAKPENPYKGTKHRIKAKGKEVELDYDDVIKRAELAEGANLTFQEAKAIKRQFEEKLGRLSNAEMENWEELIETIGVEKALKFANTIQQKQSYWESLTEDEQDRILERQRADALESELNQRKSDDERKEAQAFSMEAYKAINAEIGDALAEAKAQGVPLSDLPEVGLEIVNEMLAVLESIEAAEKSGKRWQGTPPTAKDVVKQVQSRYDERSALYLKGKTAKQLKSMLTPEQLADLRQEEIDNLYSGSTPRRTNQAKKEIEPFEANPNQSGSNRRSFKDAFSDMDRLYGVRK